MAGTGNRERGVWRRNFLASLAITNTPASSFGQGYFTPYLANAGKPESSRYTHGYKRIYTRIHADWANGECIETTRAVVCAAVTVVVCGRKPQSHLKPTASPVTLNLSSYLISCKSACRVFNRNVQHCHSAGGIYARPCNPIGNCTSENAPKCIVGGTGGAALLLFGEMTNSRGGGFPWGKARETSIFGDGADSGMLESSNQSKVSPPRDTDLPKSFTQWGQHGQLQASSTFHSHTLLRPALKAKNIPGMKKTF